MLSLNTMSLSFAGNAFAAAPVVSRAAASPVMQSTFDIRAMPGITAPLGFFDPLGFSQGQSEGRVKFLREVEIKHSRVAMLATVGFVVGEAFHPMWGGNIDVPSVYAWQETPLQDAMVPVAFLFLIHEVLSIFTFNSPFGGELFSIRSDYANGDLGWDPLGFKPTNPAELKEMQTKELNNGRLAMIAIIGMMGQELANNAKLF